MCLKIPIGKLPSFATFIPVLDFVIITQVILPYIMNNGTSKCTYTKSTKLP